VIVAYTTDGRPIEALDRQVHNEVLTPYQQASGTWLCRIVTDVTPDELDSVAPSE